jgi:signal transduction histidine kinase
MLAGRIRGTIDWFVPPTIAGDIRAWTRFLIVLAFAGFPIWAGFGLWYQLALDATLGSAVMFLVGTLGALVPFLLRRTRNLYLAANCLGGVVLTGLWVVAVLRGGFPLTVLVWTIVLPVATAMQKEFRSLTPIWAVACLLTHTVFFVLAQTGNAPEGAVHFTEQEALVEAYLVVVGLLGILVTVSWASAGVTVRFAIERDQYQGALQRASIMESIGRLAGGISHDFNNVTSIVQLSAELLERQLPEDHKAQKNVASILEAAGMAKELARQLRELSRKSEGKSKPISMNDVVRRLDPVLTRILGSGIELQTSLSPELPLVLLDERQFDQVMLSLAINARDAMPDGGVLSVSTERFGERVAMEYVDTGPGIPPERADYAFKPFDSDAGGVGMDLGLWMSRTILRSFHGDISVSSIVDVGTTIRITMPIHRPDEGPGSCD